MDIGIVVTHFMYCFNNAFFVADIFIQSDLQIMNIISCLNRIQVLSIICILVLSKKLITINHIQNKCFCLHNM